MKILAIGKKDRYEKYMPDLDIVKQTEIVFCPLGTEDDELLRCGRDADILSVDAIASVSRHLIESMPNLKLIHSEGVGYNGIDLTAAKEHNIYVCNNRGVNAGAVAEQAILLMLSLLRNVIVGHNTVLAGYQMHMKERMMLEGITELSDCKIGLIGFGDIAKATAKRLLPYGCELYYYNRTRQHKDVEEEYQIHYLTLDELASHCDIISIHVPAVPETVHLINDDFLKKMKKNSYVINTARGEIIDNEALKNAIINGTIKGAGLDTVYPEPTQKDNILLNLPKEYADHIIFSPHIGGITTSTFIRAHKNLWSNFEKIRNNERPNHIVNGL